MAQPTANPALNVVLQLLLMGRDREVSSDSQYNSWFDHENAGVPARLPLGR
jgi:hypothetical protein